MPAVEIERRDRDVQIPSTVIATNETLRQAGVIAYRIRRRKVQVLLMTSRDTGRWIIPKGNIKAGKTGSEAAQQEAFEEAGIKGMISGSAPLGIYTYPKKLGSGEELYATVEVYLLQVRHQFKKWPEKSERKLTWVSVKKAVNIVEEPGVMPLLFKLMEVETLLANGKLE